MKMIATTLTWCFLLYMCAYVLLHLKYTPPADFPKPKRDSVSLSEMKARPSKYDGAFFLTHFSAVKRFVQGLPGKPVSIKADIH